MFAYLIPLFIALAAIGCLVAAVSVGVLLHWSPRFAPLGSAILWYSFPSFVTAIIFSLAVTFSLAATLPLMYVLSLVFGDSGGVIGLWASGPLGLLLGLGVAFRYRSRQAMFANPAWRWTIGGITLAVLIGGVWLALQIRDTPEPTSIAGPRGISPQKSQSHKP
jgi:hypothetical protein